MNTAGTITFSMDVELAWGCFYRVDPRGISSRLRGSRDVLRSLLDELDAREIPVTWAFVGHLFLRDCKARHGREEARQSWRGGPWYAADPATDAARDPDWYAPDLALQAASRRAGHEIAAHGFSHMFLDDAAVSGALALEEMVLAREAAADLGLVVESFVFPRNRLAHLDALKDAGYKAYRAPGREMGGGRRRTLARKARHFGVQALGLHPRPESAFADAHGLVAIPGTCLYLSTAGFRRFIPCSSRVSRGVRGMDAACRAGGAFHLWCHLEDFLESSPGYREGFSRVLAHAERLRREGKARILTMKQISDEVFAGANTRNQ